MSKSNKLVLALIPLNLAFIYVGFRLLSPDQKIAWRGLAIVVGIGVVASIVVAVFARADKAR